MERTDNQNKASDLERRSAAPLTGQGREKGKSRSDKDGFIATKYSASAERIAEFEKSENKTINRSLCDGCRMHCLCFYDDIDAVMAQQQIINRTQIIKKKGALYKKNDEANAIYVVTSGSFKSCTDVSRGKKQITSLHLSGEMLGLGGMSGEYYGTTAIALEPSSVCTIPVSEIENLSVKSPKLQNFFLELMGREILKCRQMLTLLSSYTANQKVAALLIELTVRYNGGDTNARQFQLSMTQADFGNYLGLTVETISRILNRLQQESVISIENKTVTILDDNALKLVVENK